MDNAWVVFEGMSHDARDPNPGGCVQGCKVVRDRRSRDHEYVLGMQTERGSELPEHQRARHDPAEHPFQVGFEDTGSPIEGAGVHAP